MNVEMMSLPQAIVITGYTGMLACPFHEFHADVEKRLSRPVFSHEFGDATFAEEIKLLYKEDFLKMCFNP